LVLFDQEKRKLIDFTVVEYSKLLILPSVDRRLVLFDKAKRTLIDVTVVEDSKLLILPSVDRRLVLFHQVWYIPTASVGGTSRPKRRGQKVMQISHP
jgi:hypothetical protein